MSKDTIIKLSTDIRDLQNSIDILILDDVNAPYIDHDLAINDIRSHIITKAKTIARLDELGVTND